MVRFLVFFSLILLSAAEPPKTIDSFSGKAIAISDGDTLTVLVDKQQIKVRLEGIDAPEKSQAFGAKARDALADLVGGKTVAVHKTGEDRYGRTLARILIDGRDVSECMVARGFAWHYEQYSKDEILANLEDDARKSMCGLWSDSNPLPPWEFRKRKSGDTSEVPAIGDTSALSHWLNTSSNVRHNSSCEFFKNTKRGRSCSADEGKACGQCGG